ncbi:hypothetical protein P692DRAFT_20883505 [Suillus brevipes Sb2]|nr:hypothetical protein P692DRAFT_20883505 [Suillus brevipes Sb2]
MNPTAAGSQGGMVGSGAMGRGPRVITIDKQKLYRRFSDGKLQPLSMPYNQQGQQRNMGPPARIPSRTPNPYTASRTPAQGLQQQARS